MGKEMLEDQEKNNKEISRTLKKAPCCREVGESFHRIVEGGCSVLYFPRKFRIPTTLTPIFRVCVCYKELVLDNNRGSSLHSQQLLDLKLVRLSLRCNRDRSTTRGC